MSKYVMNNFLPSDRESAVKELDCYNYCMMQAIEHVANNRFDKAAVYHENAARSLRALSKIKKANDQARFILGQLKSERDQIILISKMVKQNE